MSLAFQGQLRMGERPIPLWMSVLKTESERDRNRRLLRMAEEAQRHRHADLADSTAPAWRFVCWHSATLVIGKRRIATIRREDASTHYFDDAWDSQVLYSDAATLRANVLAAGSPDAI